MLKLTEAMDDDSELGVPDFWCKFNFADVINYIISAWNEVPKSTLNAEWGKLWPNVENNFTGFFSAESKVQEIV